MTHETTPPPAAAPFRVVIGTEECAHCNEPASYTVLWPDGADSGRFFDEESDAEEYAHALNEAFQLGRESRAAPEQPAAQQAGERRVVTDEMRSAAECAYTIVLNNYGSRLRKESAHEVGIRAALEAALALPQRATHTDGVPNAPGKSYPDVESAGVENCFALTCGGDLVPGQESR